MIGNLLNSNKITKMLWGMLVLYFVVSVYVLFANVQYLTWDPSLCLKMTDNPGKHIPFNHYAHPDPKDLSKDQFEFVTWWTPGQYALPMLFRYLAGVKLDIALKLTSVLCLILSGIGIYKLFAEAFKQTGNHGTKTGNQILIYTLLALTGPYLWGITNVYDGGGVLLLTYSPWFIYWVIKYGKINLSFLIILLVAALAGFFFKASFTPILGGALAYLFLKKWSGYKFPLSKSDARSFLLNALLLACLMAVYMLITKFYFLDHNRNISNSSLGLRIQPRVIFFPIAAPFLNLLPTIMFNRTWHWIVTSLLVIPLCFYTSRVKVIPPIYRLILIAFGGVYVAFYALLYFLNVDVSYDVRHFNVLSLLVMPLLFVMFTSAKPIRKLSFALAIALFCSNIYWFVHCFVIEHQTGYEVNGIATGYPPGITRKLIQLDSAQSGDQSIFYFSSTEPSIALAIKRNRVLLQDNFVNFHFDNSIKTDPILYHGITKGDLYVTYSDQSFKVDSVKYLTRFERYKRFDKIFSDAGYSIYKGVAN